MSVREFLTLPWTFPLLYVLVANLPTAANPDITPSETLFVLFFCISSFINSLTNVSVNFMFLFPSFSEINCFIIDSDKPNFFSASGLRCPPFSKKVSKASICFCFSVSLAATCWAILLNLEVDAEGWSSAPIVSDSLSSFSGGGGGLVEDVSRFCSSLSEKPLNFFIFSISLPTIYLFASFGSTPWLIKKLISL